MSETITCAEAGRRGGRARMRDLTPEQRQELGRRAVNIRWARVRAQVAESRRAQGLPEHVEDPHALGQLAAEVLEGGDAA